MCSVCVVLDASAVLQLALFTGNLYKDIVNGGRSSRKDALNRGHLSIEDTACCPNYIELCTKLPLN